METDIKKIIELIDARLTMSGLRDIDAPSAAQWLDDAGLLKDSKHRKGLPLRNLLRAKLIPHAYQPGGKTTRWVIPHSKRCREEMPR